MALTGKTIGELTFLSQPTSNTLIPVELTGTTYHIAYSAITNDFGCYHFIQDQEDQGQDQKRRPGAIRQLLIG